MKPKGVLFLKKFQILCQKSPGKVGTDNGEGGVKNPKKMPQWFMDDPFLFLIINHQQNRLVKDYYTYQVTGPIELHITISQKKYWLNKFKMR